MRCAYAAAWRFLRAGTLKGDGPVMTGDGLVPFDTAALAALSLRCRQPVRMPGVSSERYRKALWLRIGCAAREDSVACQGLQPIEGMIAEPEG